MTFCSPFGSEIQYGGNFLSKCRKPFNETAVSNLIKSGSKNWFMFPKLFRVIGGGIVYYVIGKNYPKLAKNCLWIGIISALDVAIVATFWIPVRKMLHIDWNPFVLGENSL